MPLQAYDTQQGATITLSADSLALRIISIEPVKVQLPVIDTVHLGTTGKRSKIQGDLEEYQGVRVRYQNTPGLANPSKTAQTIAITGPIPPGGASGEIETGTGFVHQKDEMPGFDSGSEALQVKEFTFIYDGLTGPTRTPAA